MTHPQTTNKNSADKSASSSQSSHNGEDGKFIVQYFSMKRCVNNYSIVKNLVSSFLDSEKNELIVSFLDNEQENKIKELESICARLEEENKIMREALEFYAQAHKKKITGSGMGEYTPLLIDRGNTAKKALAELRKE